jgi:hypothetical protein
MNDTLEKKINGLAFNAKLKKITEGGFTWSVSIGSYETEFTVGNANYFNIYGYDGITTSNRNAVHFLINGSHTIIKDNTLLLRNKLLGELTYKDLRVSDKIKVISNVKLKITAPDVKDVLCSFYSEAALSLEYSLDDFASEFMQGKKISEIIECYESFEKSLKWLIQIGFCIGELKEYFESIGY